MKERPILFSAPMVRAILDGRKTQTRRVVKPLGAHHLFRFIDRADMPTGEWAWCSSSHVVSKHIRCPLGQPGYRLWVREAWGVSGCLHDPRIFYKADDHKPADLPYLLKWRPSVHMPRHLSRITLEITGIHVERLQAISEGDVQKEGVAIPSCIGLSICGGGCDSCESTAPAALHFRKIWQSLNAKRSGCTWGDNPWVWVVEFRRVEAEGGVA